MLKRRADRGLLSRLGLYALLSSSSVALLGSTLVALHATPQLHQWAWVIASVVVTLSSLMGLRSHRVISQIEAELMRCGNDRRRWQAARPLIGQGKLVSAWNDLLGFADQRDPSVAPGAATPPAIEVDEDAALVLRAYRSFPLALAVTDDAGIILRHNPALARMIASDPKEVLRFKSILEVLKLDVNSESVQRLRSGSRTVSVQHLLGKEVEQGVWRISRTRLDGRPGDAPGCIWWIDDVTQAALATQARDQFLSTATHELRTPLSNLRAYAEALVSEHGIDVEQQKEFCNTINLECVRLARLVDQLLAVDQLEAGSLVLARGEVDLGRVLNEAHEHLKSAADAKQQQITIDISPKLPLLIGDKDKLQAMVVNLLGNAIKYTQAGGAIELVATAPTNQRIEVTVADNGPGISEEELPHIFDKFFRSSDPQITEHSGNGLGLTFARDIVRLHGGEITTQSRLKEGTRFTVSLPAKPSLPTTSG